MKKKDWEQLKNKPLPELNKKLSADRDRLWQLKIDLASGKVKNVKEIRSIKKNIARELTLINQKNGEK